MIVLFTDYGLDGPYVGQVEAVLHEQAPAEKIVNLFAGAPVTDVRASAYLLAAYCRNFTEGSVFFCVVDPGVGGFADAPVILKLDGRWYVGPDNGLFDIAVRQAQEYYAWKILWRPDKLSSSFHGRDLYAPVCAMLARGGKPEMESISWKDVHQWPDDLYEIIFIDRFGNGITGVRANNIDGTTSLSVAGRRINAATTFSDVPEGALFWYENANGLVEIAVNRGNAAEQLKLDTGTVIISDQNSK